MHGGFYFSSAALMIWFAFAEQSLHGNMGAAVVNGLQLSAVAVVAQAILVMRKRLTPDWQRVLSRSRRRCHCPVRTGIHQYVPGDCRWRPLWSGISARRFFPAAAAARLSHLAPCGSDRRGFLPGAAHRQRDHPENTSGQGAGWQRVYLSGALVFGGGHVILPLLEHAVVSPGWVTQPLFLTVTVSRKRFRAHCSRLRLFSVRRSNPVIRAWSLGLVALVAIFLPGLLAMVAALHFLVTNQRVASSANHFPGH